MKKFIIWFLLIFVFLYLIAAVITTPVSWIGVLLTLFGLYQLRQQKKGKLTFSRPRRIVGAGIALTFILVFLFAKPSEKVDVTEKETEVTTKVENKKQETKTKREDEKNTAEQKANEEAVARLGLTVATISKVIDGDTFELSDGKKVRLIGVNTPESTTRTEEYGKEASKYTKLKLEGKTVYLQKDVSEADRYGRLLRIVWLQIPNDDMNEKEIRTKMFNADLVLNGYAEPSTYPPDVKYSEYFVKFAREAREQNKGLWAFGEYGTTKGDLDPKQSNSTASSSSAKKSNSDSSSRNNTGGNSSSSNNSSSNNSSSPASTGGTEYFANCTELRKVYPNGVPSSHPAYQPKMDRDKDGYACERY
ncbi:thermonuclease family protein [Anoxybacillus gonensis]|uniref:thermonuclease family protein n=1 Tax=Anoxybacillus gonensis TaxID=198467 RepID=UPI0002BEF154|nr:thermonuclease family protein [Anoxybacillus gonensis]EMI10405.1 prophage LambdaCh01 nuclease domain-containing protein [Anoxybacillus gonensis]